MVSREMASSGPIRVWAIPAPRGLRTFTPDTPYRITPGVVSDANGFEVKKF
jgi:hypothetical protein